MMNESMDIVRQILSDFGTIRLPSGEGIKIAAQPNRQQYEKSIKFFNKVGVQKRGEFSVFDPTVVEESRKLVAARGALWIIQTSLKYELYTF
jgi:hypothetical protein